ncbi:MAG TPA: hypothetical protein DD383_01935 [Rikenellaceae bacterium]|nr:hypothetical protein [Rikenellaceae bacterium]
MKRGGPSNDWEIEYIVSAKQPDASTSSATGSLASSAAGGLASSTAGGLASSAGETNWSGIFLKIKPVPRTVGLSCGGSR